MTIPNDAVAVFTIVHEEQYHLPIWFDYYGAQDFIPYVLFHNETEEDYELNTRPDGFYLQHDEWMDHNWLLKTVQDFQSFLFNSYDIVIYTDVDELLAPRPPRTLREYIEEFRLSEDLVRTATGIEVVQTDGVELDTKKPILAQRQYGFYSPLYNKTLISKVPLEWCAGFHQVKLPLFAPATPDPNLGLFHLHRADWQACLERHQAAKDRNWSKTDMENGAGKQWTITEENALRRWFYKDDGTGRQPQFVRLDYWQGAI